MKSNLYTLSILILSLNIVSCTEEIKEKVDVLRPVKYEIVSTTEAQNIRVFSGVAKAGDEIKLSFRSGGIITKVIHEKGAKVKKGETIALLDDVEANLAYEQSVSALNTAQSILKTAQSNLTRVKSLYEKGSNSLSDYETAKNSNQQAYDQYQSSKRSKSIQATQL